MSVIHDYFRAANAREAARVMDRLVGPLGPAPAFDGVETKGIDPFVMLGQLVAYIRQVPWEVDLVSATIVWPSHETKPASEEAYNSLPESSPWKTGPWLEELSPRVRDTLAAVEDARFSELAAKWAGIEEFDGHADESDLLVLIKDLVGLARRARDAGDQVYCWSSL
jgi:hypothetical protein